MPPSAPELKRIQLRAARAIYQSRGPDLVYIAKFLRIDLDLLRENESYLAGEATIVVRSNALPRWAGRAITPDAKRQGKVVREFNVAKATKKPVPLHLVSEYFGIQMDLLLTIRDELAAGNQRAFVALKHGLPHDIVQDAARALRIPAPSPPKSALCGSMSVRDILGLVDQEVAYDTIAARAGVSRERIRQIAARAGRQLRSELRAEKSRLAKAEKAKRLPDKNALRLEQMRERFREANEMFKRNESVYRIATKVGCSTNMMNQYIHRCRKLLGDGWFPYRTKRRSKHE